MDEKEQEIFDESAAFPEKPDYEQELISIMESDLSDAELRERLSDYHENDIANILEHLTPTERKRLYRVLGTDTVSEIFTYLEDVGKYIEELDSDKAADIIESMDADDAVDVLDELEDNKSHELISLMDEEARHDIDLIQSYEDDEIGSRMTTNFIVIRNDVNIKQAMKALVEQAGDNDNISTIYVVDEQEHFYGAIDLKDLIVARQYTELESLISTSFQIGRASCRERV